MKNIGSIAEYSEDRERDLLKVYFDYIQSCGEIRVADVCRHIVNAPAPRFYVSEPRATVVISQLLRGEDISRMHHTKQEMYLEIYSRFLVAREKNPHLSITQIITDIVEQPAPKFYLAPESARVMIYKAKKKWFAERRKKLRFLHL